MLKFDSCKMRLEIGFVETKLLLGLSCGTRNRHLEVLEVAEILILDFIELFSKALINVFS